MIKFTVVEVKTQPNRERIEEYAKRYGMTFEEALEKKRIGEDYFPIRDQKIVAVGILNMMIDKDEKVAIMAQIYAGEEKRVLEETAKGLSTIVASVGKPFFVTGDGRKYALELLAGRAMSYMVDAKRQEQEPTPELKEMIGLLTNPRNGYLKPFDMKDSIDMQAAFGLGTDKAPLPAGMEYRNEDLKKLVEDIRHSVLDMTTNFVCYLEAQREKIKPVVYKLGERVFKTVKIFEFPKPEPETKEEDVDIYGDDRA